MHMSIPSCMLLCSDTQKVASTSITTWIWRRVWSARWCLAGRRTTGTEGQQRLVYHVVGHEMKEKRAVRPDTDHATSRDRTNDRSLVEPSTEQTSPLYVASTSIHTVSYAIFSLQLRMRSLLRSLGGLRPFGRLLCPSIRQQGISSTVAKYFVKLQQMDY